MSKVARAKRMTFEGHKRETCCALIVLSKIVIISPTTVQPRFLLLIYMVWQNAFCCYQLLR